MCLFQQKDSIFPSKHGDLHRWVILEPQLSTWRIRSLTLHGHMWEPSCWTSANKEVTQTFTKSTPELSTPYYKAPWGQYSFWVQHELQHELFRKTRTTWQLDCKVLWQKQGLWMLPKIYFWNTGPYRYFIAESTPTLMHKFPQTREELRYEVTNEKSTPQTRDNALCIECTWSAS